MPGWGYISHTYAITSHGTAEYFCTSHSLSNTHTMKKIFFVALLFAASGTVLFAQQGEPSSTVKVNLLSPVIRTFSGFYEHALGKSFSLQLGVAYTGASIDEVKLRGWGITPEFRYYASQKGKLQGIYLAPYGRLNSLKGSDLNASGTITTIGGGLLVGHQWIVGKGFVVDVFLGPSYSNARVKGNNSENEIEVPETIDGVGVRAGLTIGISF